MSRKPDLSSLGCERKRQLNRRWKQEALLTVVEVIRSPLTIVVLCGMAWRTTLPSGVLSK